MSTLTFYNNLSIQQVLVDNTNKDLSQMRNQISNPQRTLSIKSEFDSPDNGIMYYINPDFGVSNISLYKQTGLNQKIWDYLGTFSGDHAFRGFIDANVANRIPVRYMVCAGNTDVAVAITDYMSFNWDKWSIQDIIYDKDNNVYKTTGNLYLFRSNVSAGEINANSSTIKYESLGRYGKVYKGDLKYESSQFSCLFGDFEVCQDIQYSKNLILKDVKNIEQVTDALNTKPDDKCYLYLRGIDGFEYSKYFKSGFKYNKELEKFGFCL